LDIKVSWNGKLGFTAVGPSGHEVFMDTSTASGGEDKGPRPTEVALAAIGGCTGIDIAFIMKRMRQEFQDFWMDISAERAEEEPKRFTKIHIHYTLVGPDLNPERVDRAVELTRDKYCPVINSFNAEITTSWEVLDGTEG